jgi:3alpha(or 20beta)-hydroxysteroid dehydrogenase
VGAAGLSEVAALELAPRGIRTNIVHPGYIETPLMASANPVFVDAHPAMTPQVRAGRVDDVAPLVVYLLSTRRRTSTARRSRSTAGTRHTAG